MGDRFFTMRAQNRKNNLILECHRSIVDVMAIFVCQAHDLESLVQIRELGQRVYLEKRKHFINLYEALSHESEEQATTRSSLKAQHHSNEASKALQRTQPSLCTVL